MLVYTYNPITGDLVGTSMAEESPLEPGVLLMPAHSTSVSPPEFDPEKEIVYFEPEKEIWRKQNIEAETHKKIFSDEDIDKLKNELFLVKKKREDVLKKLGLEEKEISILLLNLPSEDMINNLKGSPIPDSGLPSLLPPDSL